MHMHCIQHKSKASQKVLWLALSVNVFVFILKMTYGYWSQSLSVIADSLHSLADSGASIIGLVSVYIASRPKDDNHHYGHQKFEALAVLVISAMIALTSWELLQHSIENIMHKHKPNFHPIGVVIVFVCMIIHYLLARYENHMAKQLNSDVLHADAQHSASDVWVSLSVIVSIICSKLNILYIDGIISIGIALYLAYIAFMLMKETFLLLSDAAFLDTSKIENIANQHKHVTDCHNIRTRGKEGNAFVDLHIRLDQNMSLKQAHDIAHEIEDQIKQHIPGISDVLIHTEPSEIN